VKIKRILAPTDFLAPSLAAVDEAASLARRFGAEVVLLHVHEPPYVGNPDPYVVSASFRLLVAERRRLAGEQMGMVQNRLSGQHAKCRALIGAGRPAEEIVAAARKQKADLIVMATRGHTGAKRLLLGSVAERVVRGAPCPVLTLRPRTASERSRR
jgi:nucleotide-binding universal stress UspA family protein